MRRTPQDRLSPSPRQALAQWRGDLIDRRAFLLRLAGGSLAALFPLPGLAQERGANPTATDPWPVLEAVQDRLLPSEPGIPGAQEINALDYLRFVVADPKVDADTRAFLLKGVGWLQGIAREQEGQDFLALDSAAQERVLHRIATSDAGENWLSTLITYLLEALLTDPVYGGNPDGIGWRWLQHTPGFPRPPPGKRFFELTKI